MKLLSLIKNLDVIKIINKKNVDVENVQIDSNSVMKGSLFVCLKGEHSDGHTFVKKAERYGAVAIICTSETDTQLPQIVVKDTRLALSIIASEFYGNVSCKMKIIGVLGTNGKTTTAHLIGNILNSVGIKCGIIGTLGTFYGENFIEPTLTTPDPLELHKILYDMYHSGYKTVVMEVSAHASYLQKVGGIKFYAGVLTNFTRDHLDFFKDMETYKKAKSKFFTENDCKYIIVNADDDLGREIIKSNSSAITYGIENPADVFAIDVIEKENQTEFVMNLFDCIYDVKLKLVGKFNVYNALAAATTSALVGAKTEKIIDSLNSSLGASGRMQRVYDGDFTIYIDYAHTPDGLEKVLCSLRPICKNRLICVFGCGGNRDAGKRVEMGEISGKYADFTIVTSDNPRYEEPMEIIYQIEKGVLKNSKKYVLIQERAEAIEYALTTATKGDVIIIAGKGSENYQEILGIKRPYNDKDTVEEIIRGIKN